ncbi:lipoate--protein ligase [Eubacterium aggregans]|uniref:lipoate--protein ligase n=1 Tax=Eubacterium aggregans TaxID=81409 RepID=UPI003F2E092E
MRYIDSPMTDPTWNLALEEYVFDHLPKDEDYFMLWQNDNTVVVGKYQNTDAEIDAQAVAEQKVTVVRRLSGGGAVFHDMGNLNFTFITDANTVSDFDFLHFTKPVLGTLARFGITAEFNGRNDLTINGYKFSGNAQYTRDGRVMHHGTLLFSSDLSRVQSILAFKPEKYKQKGVKSVRSRVGNISDALTAPLSLDEFKIALLEEVFSEGDVQTYTLTDSDRRAIANIQAERYATWEWNYGASPGYNATRSGQFDFGGITLYLNLVDGIIRDIHICGDFFGDGVDTLCHLLVNLPLDKKSLESRLTDDAIKGTINGLTSKDLFTLLFD